MGKRGDDQHRYGSHYTPTEVARVSAAFAVRRSEDLIFDPSCGDGRRLQASLELKGQSDGADPRQGLFGIDRFELPIRTAARSGFQVACADFFEVEPEARLRHGLILPARFDAIVGNP